MIFLGIGCRQEALDCCPIFLKLQKRKCCRVTIVEVNGEASALLLRLPRQVIVYNFFSTLGTAIISGISGFLFCTAVDSVSLKAYGNFVDDILLYLVIELSPLYFPSIYL